MTKWQTKEIIERRTSKLISEYTLRLNKSDDYREEIVFTALSDGGARVSYQGCSNDIDSATYRESVVVDGSGKIKSAMNYCTHTMFPVGACGPNSGATSLLSHGKELRKIPNNGLSKLIDGILIGLGDIHSRQVKVMDKLRLIDKRLNHSK